MARGENWHFYRFARGTVIERSVTSQYERSFSEQMFRQLKVEFEGALSQFLLVSRILKDSTATIIRPAVSSLACFAI